MVENVHHYLAPKFWRTRVYWDMDQTHCILLWKIQSTPIHRKTLKNLFCILPNPSRFFIRLVLDIFLGEPKQVSCKHHSFWSSQLHMLLLPFPDNAWNAFYFLLWVALVFKHAHFKIVHVHHTLWMFAILHRYTTWRHLENLVLVTAFRLNK